MAGKDVLLEKDLTEKVATIKRFEYSPLGSELKKQTDIAKEKYQRSYKSFSSKKDNKHVNESLNKKEADAEILTKKKYNKLNLISNKFSFHGYSDNKKFDTLSFKSKHSYLLTFSDDLENFTKIKPAKLSKKKEQEKGYDAAVELYNKRFENFCDQYEELLDAKKKLDHKFKSINLKFKGYNYDGWFTKKESDDKTLEGDEKEVKEGKLLQILTPNKLLTRLLVLLAQIKAVNNSYKLKKEIRQIINLLYQHDVITKKVLKYLIRSL